MTFRTFPGFTVLGFFMESATRTDIGCRFTTFVMRVNTLAEHSVSVLISLDSRVMNGTNRRQKTGATDFDYRGFNAGEKRPMRLSTGEAFCVTLFLFRRVKNADAG